jgi:hypothetical protein
VGISKTAYKVSEILPKSYNYEVQDLSNQVKRTEDHFFVYTGMDALPETSYAIELFLYSNLRCLLYLQRRMDESFNWQNRPGECLNIELRLLPSR